MDPVSRQEPVGTHIPVMLPEVLNYLNVQPEGIYLDGTVGAGGHATPILDQLSGQGKLICIDRDAEALEICKTKFSASARLFSLHHAPYDTFPRILSKLGIPQVNGILLDLGLSSLQLNSASRGFSFQTSGPLDMRFDPTTGIPVDQWIRTVSERKLAEVIRDYGEEFRARAIAHSIKTGPPVHTTEALKEAIRRSTPPRHREKTLARVFQALRIVVNQELEHLKKFLDQFIQYLAPAGRIVIISYHSLEDRLVKQKFRALAQGGSLQILTRKPLSPSPEEQQANRRSRSAKLRAAEKTS